MATARSILFAIIAAMLTTHAGAAEPQPVASAVMDSYCIPGSFSRHSAPWYSTTRCSEDWGVEEIRDRLTVTITPRAEDAGAAGAFYIVLRVQHRVIGMFTTLPPEQWQQQMNGAMPAARRAGTDVGAWVEYGGGMLEPAQIASQIGPATITVLDKTRLCAITGVGTFQIWAGYGILTPTAAHMVASYSQSRTATVPPEHMRMVFVQRDMDTGEKYTKAWQQTCTEQDVETSVNDGGM